MQVRSSFPDYIKQSHAFIRKGDAFTNSNALQCAYEKYMDAANLLEQHARNDADFCYWDFLAAAHEKLSAVYKDKQQFHLRLAINYLEKGFKQDKRSYLMKLSSSYYNISLSIEKRQEKIYYITEAINCFDTFSETPLNDEEYRLLAFCYIEKATTADNHDEKKKWYLNSIDTFKKIKKPLDDDSRVIPNQKQ